jgi:excinuclease ABC subunit A
MKELNESREEPGKHKEIVLHGLIDKVLIIDQSPIGRTPRSNPATYTKVFDEVRKVFSGTQESKLRGYDPGRFSFNLKGGRCDACEGDGVKKIEMNFLPDVYVECEECKGRRYNKETLDVKYKGKNIAEVLSMTVEEALKLFENIPSIKNKLATLSEVGLDYISLGQSSTTLSGGESQRIKLTRELAKRDTGKTLYLLDEPTTGLHFHDVKKLLKVLDKLVEKGNTVIVIEHNLDVIKSADHIIDLGPEGGEAGGEVIAEGTPEEVAKNPKSYTGQYLKKHLR